jgi:NAD(P)-dependent dehydrogenase (short-subunit alcohol dehydrogenase family)
MMKISELFDIRGQVALVTGGAGGIGYACAEVLAENGAKVCIIDRDTEKLSEAEKALGRVSDSIMALTADALDLTSMQEAVASVMKAFGRLDIAFVNAGIGGGPGFLDMKGARNPKGAVENITDEHWHSVVDGNLSSVFISLKSVVPPMRAQKSGSIIVTASVAALKTENFVGTPYIAAKAGVAHLVHQVALELAKFGVRVNAIAPGSFLTGIGGGRMADPFVLKRFSEANPIRRIAIPDEIKGLALLLASPASSYMTGAVLAIDGGGSLGVAD